MLTNITGFGNIPGRAGLLLVGMLMLSACASKQTIGSPPALQNAGPAIQVTDVDVLAVSPAMEAFLERYILPYSSPETRFNLLYLAVTSGGVLGFDYDDSRTLTASEAFAARSGNCIGFANMMIALARGAGLEAHYQEVRVQPLWSSEQDTVLINKHINVIIKSPQYSWVVDVSGLDIRPQHHRRLIADNTASALYYSNIGANALLEYELPTAYAYLLKAIAESDQLTDPWINLGVVFGRNEQLQAAETAYQTALQIDVNERSAMNNLYEIYLQQEDFEAAERLQARVEKYRRKNPYYLLVLSEEAREEARFEDAIRLLQRAIEKKDDEHLLYFALAKSQFLAGEPIQAQNSLRRAQELAPASRLAEYNRPLQELVLED